MAVSPKLATRLLAPKSGITRRRALALGGAAAIAPFGLHRLGAAAQDDATGAIFPENRVLLYYGFPENPNMGILGQHEPDELLELLNAEAENYRAADPDRPVKIGLELIASVAQGDPGPDGLYIADTSGEFLDLYTEFTAENDMLLFLDVQMGFKTPKEDYEGLDRWLDKPHVHLGIDPEFRMYEGELPGQHIGQVTGAEVTEAQNWLVELAKKHNLPPKVLIVHQFHYTMIEEKDQIAPVDGVDLVIVMDGFGPPEMKADTYEVVITEEPIEFNGIKIFYDQDIPLMTAEEVIAFDPSPDLIVYH
jgi:hypothetical protein